MLLTFMYLFICFPTFECQILISSPGRVMQQTSRKGMAVSFSGPFCCSNTQASSQAHCLVTVDVDTR